MGKRPVAAQVTILPVDGLQPPLNSAVIIDFNRKSSDHIESPASLFVNSLILPFGSFLKIGKGISRLLLTEVVG